MAFHYTLACTPPHDLNLCEHAGRYSPALQLGAYGVELFFVISGLVISMTVLRCTSSLDFLVKRFARLWPAYLVAATLTFTLMRAFGPASYQTTFTDYLFNWTMLAPKFGHPYVDGVYWSLGPELKFYVWTALGFLLLRRRFWMMAIGVAVAGSLVDLWSPRLADVFLVKQIGFFLIGMAAYLGIFERQARSAIICGVVGLVVCGLQAADLANGVVPLWTVLAGLILAAGSMLGLLAAGTHLPIGPLAWLGRISYSLYLVHNRIGVTLIAHLHRLGLNDLSCMAIAAASTMLLAWALFRFVEQPGQRLVVGTYRRLRPQPAPKLAVA